MPKSACTNGRATGIDHMPTLPMVPTATANPSRRHAAGESTSLSWRSRKSKELPGNEFTTRTSHAPPVSSTLRGLWLQFTSRQADAITKRLSDMTDAELATLEARMIAAAPIVLEATAEVSDDAGELADDDVEDSPPDATA
jgi:hypothetical protein